MVTVELHMRGAGPGQGGKAQDTVRILEVDAKGLEALKKRYPVGDATKKDDGIAGKPGETNAYLIIKGAK